MTVWNSRTLSEPEWVLEYRFQYKLDNQMLFRRIVDLKNNELCKWKFLDMDDNPMDLDLTAYSILRSVESCF